MIGKSRNWNKPGYKVLTVMAWALFQRVSCNCVTDSRGHFTPLIGNVIQDSPMEIIGIRVALISGQKIYKIVEK